MKDFSEAEKFPRSLAEYAAAREALLAKITQLLANDPRFAAAWLLGSYGRNEQDAVSDIDIYVAVEEVDSQILCQQALITASPVVTASGMTAPGSTAGRLDLFRMFGEPVNIHENHSNAPERGTFSAVLYRNPPVMVDWTLVPLSVAFRAQETRLLFDRVGVRVVDQKLVSADPAERLTERTAFFWMMAAVTAKYIIRGRMVEVQGLLNSLAEIADEIGDLQNNQPKKRREQLYPSIMEQTARLRELCEQVAGDTDTAEPRKQIGAILHLLEENRAV